MGGLVLCLRYHRIGPGKAMPLQPKHFGQTVNIAARVQSLANGSEICMTESLYTAPGVRELLAGHDVISFDAPLRGMEGKARMYRLISPS